VRLVTSTRTGAAERPAAIAGPLVALIVGAIAMAISPILVRLADVGPFASAFWRVALALPVLYAWMRVSERGARPASGGLTQPIVWVGVTFAGDLFFWHLAILHTSVANATFFATMAPLWVVLFAWLIFGQRASGVVLTGLALCLVGGTILVSRSIQLRSGGSLGDLYGLVTGIFFGLYFLAVSAARTQGSASRVTFQATAITAAMLLVVALLLEHRMLPHTLRGLATLVALAWVSHAGGQGLLSIALGRLPAVFSSLVIFLEAIAAAGFAWLILSEPVSWVQAAGGATILAGIFVARPR
jgi:drug/metabolite transporter (DMT)-like permease